MEILINLFLIILGSLNCIKFLTPEAPLDLKIIGSLFMIFFGMKAFPIKEYKPGFIRQTLVIIFFSIPALFPWPLLRIFSFFDTVATLYYLEKNVKGNKTKEEFFERPFDIREEDWEKVTRFTSLWERKQMIDCLRNKYKEQEKIKRYWKEKIERGG